MQHCRALSVFPILAIVSLYCLWKPFLQNGTVSAMESAVQREKFADGTSLRYVYTGLIPIDHALSTLVAFTYYPTNGDDKATRLLYIEILSALQTGQLWCLIESLRSGRTSIALAMPAVWGLLWNGLGGGAILPIFAFFQLRNRPRKQSIPLGDAKTLIPAFVAASCFPAILAVAPPLVNRGSYDHQTIIGFFQMTPLALTVLQHVLARLINLVRSAEFASDLPWIRGALGFAAAASLISHIYAVACALLSSGINRSIYFGISNAQVCAASIDKIALGSALFLQWDYGTIYITTVLWGVFLVRETKKINVAVLTLGLALMNGFLGPGATMSWVFYWREGRIREAEAEAEARKVL